MLVLMIIAFSHDLHLHGRWRHTQVLEFLIPYSNPRLFGGALAFIVNARTTNRTVSLAALDKDCSNVLTEAVKTAARGEYGKTTV
jgi:hypothetical protein